MLGYDLTLCVIDVIDDIMNITTHVLDILKGARFMQFHDKSNCIYLYKS